ncbi:MAG: aminotransferase class I/II-fold pyridoxal phosphate-dependent enzyme [Bacteroidales bacterium]|nr:aminotransferase class I/II-fold pyridoxal phosphate-dependent enzyme [Bacteroidales bacterium]
MIISPAERTQSVKPYYFSVKNPEIAALSAERMAKGLDPVINLGIGAPDGMPPAEAIETLRESALLPDSHKYQNYRGLPQLRAAFASWYERYYGVALDPETDIQPLMGSKEGILLISMAFVNPGDKVLVPDPGYPTYTSASLLVGAQMLTYDLKAGNGFLPDFDALESMDLDGVKLMWTNYPNMPTGTPASMELYERLVAFGKKHNILIVNDNPYSFILNDSPVSILAVEGSRECCLEMNSLSKAHNMSGWRIGMVCGAKEYVAEVLKVKSQMDSGMFRSLQLAAIKALEQGPEWFRKLNEGYRERLKVVCRLYDLLGLRYNKGSQGLFVWGEISPDNHYLTSDTSKTLGERMSDKLLYEAGVFMTPGMVFGKNGSNYIRASLCAPVELLEKAIEKISAL